MCKNKEGCDSVVFNVEHGVMCVFVLGVFAIFFTVA